MINSEVFKKFKEVTVTDDEEIDCWFPNGKNCVRVRFKDKSEVVFTYWGKRKWRVETVDSYLDSIMVEVK